ncbi:exocyst complex component EXO70H1-like [Magnolia sinica]|uniref:exocyst complex component EXO70H1-like n=1 Tax=Magnolia sinica TaxID=86752 RepID=UPI00265AB386|nr:exocyst complex component EXO70H1-like [Magnolia sinica]
MPRKGMRSLFFSHHSSKSPSSSIPSSPSHTRPSSPSYSHTRASSPSPSYSHTRPSSPSPSYSHSRPSSPYYSHTRPSSPLHPTFSESIMEENIATAEAIITKWDPESSSYSKITSLFYENRLEALEFLRSVRGLQRSMHFYVNQKSISPKLVHAQNLMQTAMKRLEKEFYQILAANREQLDPESVSSRSSTATRSTVSDYEDDVGSEDEIQIAGNSIQEVEHEASIAMSDLRAIAECMISTGYGKECVKIYKIIRKSIIDEGIYRLGFERMSSNHIQKMDWEALEHKIKNWVNTTKITIKTLFYGERILCDRVFAASNTIKESCFAEIAKEAATHLFAFPEAIAKCKKSPERMFRFLDLYNTISELWPEIESIFSYESTSTVRTQAINSLIKLSDGIRTMLADFESAIQKDTKRSPVPGGGLHPLTRYVMNYVGFLSDYSEILGDIFADYPFQVQSPLPETLLENSPTAENPLSAISTRLEWLILVLLCKLDGKAELYKDVGLSYLFLANNLQYVTSKVRGCDLQFILGDEWISKHEFKVHQYVANYERMAWSKVGSTLPANPTAEMEPQMVKERFREFNSAFEAACRVQSGWVVPDEKLREEIKRSVGQMIVPVYRAFYGKYRFLLRGESSNLARFAPEDLDNHISNLFYGNGVSGSVSVSVLSR